MTPGNERNPGSNLSIMAEATGEEVGVGRGMRGTAFDQREAFASTFLLDEVTQRSTVSFFSASVQREGGREGGKEGGREVYFEMKTSHLTDLRTAT
jgi:hypothetical protein